MIGKMHSLIHRPTPIFALRFELTICFHVLLLTQTEAKNKVGLGTRLENVCEQKVHTVETPCKLISTFRNTAP